MRRTLTPEAVREHIGRRLRAVRGGLWLSLSEVEAMSQGRWKAPLVGSYERASRMPTVDKLAALCDWYGVGMADVVPGWVVPGAAPVIRVSAVLAELDRLRALIDGGALADVRPLAAAPESRKGAVA